jgi:exopolysaccharide production protein ExoY
MAIGSSASAERQREKPSANQVRKAVSSSDNSARHRAADRDVTFAVASEVSRPGNPASAVGGRIKRGFDIVASISGIIVLLPLCCLIALAIKAWDGGPVLYRHRRIGLNGTPFDCLKFRTMVVNADEVLVRHLAADSAAAREWEADRKLKDDPRITPLGLSMRKTSVDELPQLLNILKGEMSFVGPRPIVTAEVPKYGDCINHYLCTRPGLTGPWQVSGRNNVEYAARVALDRGYIEEWSFRRDVAIILKTIRVVVFPHGSY